MARHAPEPPKRAKNARVVGTARKVDLGSTKAVKHDVGKRQDWQVEIYDYLETVPELAYTTLFVANAMGQLRLFIATKPPDDPEADPIPITDPEAVIPPQLAARAQYELDRVKGDMGGRAEIQSLLAANLVLAADCTVIMRGPTIRVEDGPDGVQLEVLTQEFWDVKSVLEIDVGQGNPPPVKVRDEPNGPQYELDPDTDAYYRIYQRHPAWSNLAFSNSRALLGECEAIILLTNQIKAEAKSNQSNGVFMVPNELSFTPPAPDDDDETATEDAQDPFDKEYYDAMLDPIADPSSPYSAAALLMRGPYEYLDRVQYIPMARDNSTILDARIEARVERIARGVDLPVEITKGHQQTTFANAAQVDQDTFDDHLKSKAEFIVNAWTASILWPALLDAGYAPELVEQVFVWYDPSALITDPDPADAAEEALKLRAISKEAFRRYKKFSEDDAPTPEEEAAFAAEDAAKNQPFGGGKNQPAPPQPIQASARPLRAARSNPLGRTLHEIDRETRTRVLLAANTSMLRVLERAGTTLKARAPKDIKPVLRTVGALYAAAHLGERLMADAGFTEGDLIGPDAFAGLEQQFMSWGQHAQTRAIDAVHKAIGLSTAERDALKVKNAGNLFEAWEWLRGQLVGTAQKRLFDPDPTVPTVGEFDPTLARVPAGMVRHALAVAGGDTSIQVRKGEGIYVALSNGEPLGGIATGETIERTLRDRNVLVEAYEWAYGPAPRQHPFEEHEDLDGVPFASFDADTLGGSPLDDFYYPGDHDGCLCDVIPVYVLPEELEE